MIGKIRGKLHRRLHPDTVLEANDSMFHALVARAGEYGLNTEPRDARIVVSLTSFPARFETLHLVIRSMLVQTMKPDQIILYLDEDVDLSELPESLLAMKRYGLQIEKRPGNIKPHKKYYYAIREHPADIVITVDDDLLYPEDTVAELYATHARFPSCVVAARAHRILFNMDGSIKPYTQWEWVSHVAYRPSMRLLVTGCGGALYPPRCMGEELFDMDRIQALSVGSDDLWLKVMQIRSGTKVVLCDRRIRVNRVAVPDSQRYSLNSVNVHQNKNDVYMDNLMKHYRLTAADFGYAQRWRKILVVPRKKK